MGERLSVMTSLEGDALFRPLQGNSVCCRVLPVLVIIPSCMRNA